MKKKKEIYLLVSRHHYNCMHGPDFIPTSKSEDERKPEHRFTLYFFLIQVFTTVAYCMKWHKKNKKDWRNLKHIKPNYLDLTRKGCMHDDLNETPEIALRTWSPFVCTQWGSEADAGWGARCAPFQGPWSRRMAWIPPARSACSAWLHLSAIWRKPHRTPLCRT